MYNAVFEHVMSRIPARPLGMTSVMMASHNEDSVRFAVQKMHEMGLTPEVLLEMVADFSDIILLALVYAVSNAMP